MKTIKDAKTFDELLNIKYGKLGTPNRDEFESRAKAFVVGEMIKDARKKAHLTQDELAEKTGTKKIRFICCRLSNCKNRRSFYTISR